MIFKISSSRGSPSDHKVCVREKQIENRHRVWNVLMLESIEFGAVKYVIQRTQA